MNKENAFMPGHINTRPVVILLVFIAMIVATLRLWPVLPVWLKVVLIVLGFLLFVGMALSGHSSAWKSMPSDHVYDRALVEKMISQKIAADARQGVAPYDGSEKGSATAVEIRKDLFSLEGYGKWWDESGRYETKEVVDLSVDLIDKQGYKIQARCAMEWRQNEPHGGRGDTDRIGTMLFTIIVDNAGKIMTFSGVKA